jgi:pimeloyl-ACP methyl ester carboxylesterase
MADRKHTLLNVNGIRLHSVEAGDGPLVLLLHGFPESWYSWRHQLEAISAAGYRAVAIDQRGYGRSSKPRSNAAYRIGRLVEDVVGVVRAYGYDTATVIGHDWGSPVAWTAAWLHPDVFDGVMGISVPFARRGQIALPGNPFGEIRPAEYHRTIAGPGRTFYQEYFAAQDAVIDEIEMDVGRWLTGLLYSVSGDALAAAPPSPEQDPIEALRHGPLCIPDGARMFEAFAYPGNLPQWLPAADLAFFVEEFQRSGFGGPLSYYHNVDGNWHDLAEQDATPLQVPGCFVGGQFDIGTAWGAEAIARAPEVMTDYLGSRILDGCGHWIQQERPRETNRLILEFLDRVH